MLGLGIALSWLGVIGTWLLRGDIQWWLISLGVIFLGFAVSIIGAIIVKNPAPLMSQLVPVGMGAFFLVSNYGADINLITTGVQRDLTMVTSQDNADNPVTIESAPDTNSSFSFGRRSRRGSGLLGSGSASLNTNECAVSLHQSMADAHIFDKPCEQVSIADLWWTAGWYHETRGRTNAYWAYGDLMGAPGVNAPEAGCLISATADGFSSPSTSAHIGRPCSAVSISERLRLANAPQGATVWTTPWYSTKWP